MTEPTRQQLNELERAVLTNQKRKSATMYVDTDAVARLLEAYKHMRELARLPAQS